MEFRTDDEDGDGVAQPTGHASALDRLLLKSNAELERASLALSTAALGGLHAEDARFKAARRALDDSFRQKFDALVSPDLTRKLPEIRPMAPVVEALSDLGARVDALVDAVDATRGAVVALLDHAGLESAARVRDEKPSGRAVRVAVWAAVLAALPTAHGILQGLASELGSIFGR